MIEEETAASTPQPEEADMVEDQDSSPPDEDFSIPSSSLIQVIKSRDAIAKTKPKKKSAFTQSEVVVSEITEQ